MLELAIIYLINIGPFVLAATGLGLLIPTVITVAEPSRWIIAFGTLALCLLPLGGVNVAAGSEGSITRQVGWGLIFLVAGFLAVRRSDGSIQFDLDMIPPAFTLLLGFAVLSILWSANSLVTARRVVQVVGVFLIALSLARHRGNDDVLLKFWAPGLIFLLLGFLVMLKPSLSFDSGGAFKGIASHKNTWGQFTLLMGLIFLVQAVKKRNALLNWILFSFATISLVATKSATSILIFFVAINFIFVSKFIKKHGRALMSAGLVLFMAAATLISGYFVVNGHFPFEQLYTAALNFSGRDSTLTGRTALWEMMNYEIARHPWLGVGYGSFWLGLEGQSASIVRSFSWLPGQAHNGYIDLINELGYIGLALFIATVISHMINLWRLYRTSNELISIFHFAILIAALGLNISESSLMRTTHLWWIVLTVSIVEVHVLRTHFRAKAKNMETHRRFAHI